MSMMGASLSLTYVYINRPISYNSMIGASLIYVFINRAISYNSVIGASLFMCILT